VKFDVRYVILLTSVKPLVVHIYRNFFLRFSNIPFSMSEFDTYEKHFTVMNYGENLVLKHIKCADFLGKLIVMG
jgi:tubulin--tyrosine ligase-like protein 12